MAILRHNLFQTQARLLSQAVPRRRASFSALRRSYLYVPCSSQRMLEKSLSVDSDVIIYDLEDSVAPKDKAFALDNLVKFLQGGRTPEPGRVSIRVNDQTTPFFQEDLHRLAECRDRYSGLVLPKVHTAEYLENVSTMVPPHSSPLQIVASIESAQAIMNIGSIAGWGKRPSEVEQLQFAAEDYCADTSIIRTRSRHELLFTRSQIVNAAKAFKLEAIDMVCIHYKDLEYLEEECQNGRALGFTGKQAIHPSQVSTIQSAFVPTSAEILRAAKILYQMELAQANRRGAIGLEGEMIDAPMIKQAENIIGIAKATGLDIPDVSVGAAVA
ncbi:beta subunit of citrate lyase [Cylindrobasidium torrendii FP15055 ss-10]|uniref:Beta subunit of citrate lyase n=1 Tax=Cylindrobasidium torrendii FP15055 ss-10 TaxID=1314674 RepID=A0A0D7BLY9_9AGAR|nr:beta subunit of citrate lyase [Cylindrobasidium torrendii FP15055 ss-10]